jgi:hypothetical protein
MVVCREMRRQDAAELGSSVAAMPYEEGTSSSLRAVLHLTGEEGATSCRDFEITYCTFATLAEAGAFLAFLDVQKGRRQERRSKVRRTFVPLVASFLQPPLAAPPVTGSWDCAGKNDQLVLPQVVRSIGCVLSVSLSFCRSCRS